MKIYKEKDTVEKIYFVFKGEIELSKKNDENKGSSEITKI